MQTQGAIFWPGARSWSVEPIEIDAPHAGEVLIKMEAAGLCHSDYHYVAGDAFSDHPILGGHEGAGVVQEVGEGVTSVQPGDHVITTFMPSCGHCRWCRSGHGNLCDRGAELLSGKALDGTHRLHARGEDIGPMTFLGTFAPYVCAPVDALIKYEEDIPATVAAIVGCAVPTGWGTAVHVAQVEIGDTAVVIGCGGVGMNAIQGARLAGAQHVIAVDPSEFKRAQAPTFGATHAVADLEEASALVGELTGGVMAERVIVTMGVVDGELIGQIADLVCKTGVLAIGGVSRMDQTEVNLPLMMFVMMEKQLRGGLYGGGVPGNVIPTLLDLYRKGDLLLDQLVTRTYDLEQINEGYEDMVAGRNIRGVITFGKDSAL
jgi:S-(hydroxymethyl)glutathione dehydrogenase / alcohol dehydrogenase